MALQNCRQNFNNRSGVTDAEKNACLHIGGKGGFLTCKGMNSYVAVVVLSQSRCNN